MKTLKLSLVLLGSMAMIACSGQNSSDSGATSNTLVGQNYTNINPTSTPIVVSPSTANIGTYQSITLQVSGGIRPYRFTRLSGIGNMGYTNGVFTSAGSPSTVVILITDSAGASTSATILVAGGSSTSGGGSTATTNCSGMLNAPNVAFMDNSSTGLSYGTASNLTTPSGCASWCGAVGAAYCMWSPGSNSSPVCVAWPAGTSMSYYASSWTTYSGTCQ